MNAARETAPAQLSLDLAGRGAEGFSAEVEAALELLSSRGYLGYPKLSDMARYVLDGDCLRADVVIARVDWQMSDLVRAEPEYRANMHIDSVARCMEDLDALRVVRAALVDGDVPAFVPGKVVANV